MITKRQIVITSFFIGHLLIVLFTNISLIGFWTDLIFSMLLSFFALRLVLKNNTSNRPLTLTLRGSTIICSLLVFGLLVINLLNPFSVDTLKLRSFYLQSVDGRLFNAYFKPVGAYSGGFGNFWITESPKYFPFVECQIYYDRTVHYDLNDDNWDGQPTDNYEVVRTYIKEEVIEQDKAKASKE